MEEKLFDIIKKARGSLLMVGISDVFLIDEIEKNEKISNSYLLENRILNNEIFFIKGKNEKINIKKIKKYFAKKKIKTIICEYKSINKFLRNFVPGSIYINNDKIYIYGKMTDSEIEEIKNKYKRYTKEIEVEKLYRTTLITINNRNTKNSFFRNIIDYILNLVAIIIELFTSFLRFLDI